MSISKRFAMTVAAGALVLVMAGCASTGAPAVSDAPTGAATSTASASVATPSGALSTGAVNAAACKSIVNSYLTLQTAYIDGLGTLTEQPSAAYTAMSDAQAAFAAEVDKLPAGPVKEKATAEENGFAAMLASFAAVKDAKSLSALSQAQRDEISQALKQAGSSTVVMGAGLVELCTPYLR